MRGILYTVWRKQKLLRRNNEKNDRPRSDEVWQHLGGPTAAMMPSVASHQYHWPYHKARRYVMPAAIQTNQRTSAHEKEPLKRSCSVYPNRSECLPCPLQNVTHVFRHQLFGRIRRIRVGQHSSRPDRSNAARMSPTVYTTLPLRRTCGPP